MTFSEYYKQMNAQCKKLLEKTDRYYLDDLKSKRTDEEIEELTAYRQELRDFSVQMREAHETLVSESGEDSDSVSAQSLIPKLSFPVAPSFLS